jgi:hypothetical protein
MSACASPTTLITFEPTRFDCGERSEPAAGSGCFSQTGSRETVTGALGTIDNAVTP